MNIAESRGPAFRPDAVGRGQAGPRLLDYRQPRGAPARIWWRRRRGSGSKRRCANWAMCRTSSRGRLAQCPHPLGRRAGADHRQFDFRRHRAGTVRRVGAARLCRDPGAVALRRRARGPHALGAAVAAPRGDHHGGIAGDRRRRAAAAPRRHSDRGDLGSAAAPDRCGCRIRQLRSRRRGGAASRDARPKAVWRSSAATIRARRGAGTDSTTPRWSSAPKRRAA